MEQELRSHIQHRADDLERSAVVFGFLNALILRPLNVPWAQSLYGLQHGRARALARSFDAAAP